MTSRAHRLTVIGAVVAASACASGPSQRTATPFSEDLRERQEVRISIQNRNFSDVTLWTLVRDGRRQRLGTVTGKSDAVFTLPWRFSEPMRLEFDLLAGPRCVTDNLDVDPGDTLELQIATDLAMMNSWCR